MEIHLVYPLVHILQLLMQTQRKIVGLYILQLMVILVILLPLHVFDNLICR